MIANNIYPGPQGDIPCLNPPFRQQVTDLIYNYQGTDCFTTIEMKTSQFYTSVQCTTSIKLES